MKKITKIPLILSPQEEGGWTVTSPLIPELITEIDDLKDLPEVLKDAFEAVKELYEDLGKDLPVEIFDPARKRPVWFESLIELTA
ncbi:MAG: type II toxin-antitoxin system HicB family antitoxin [Candidatus Desulfofervidaceae bacterium]|nr:type II toxin-antitoxin system HicB family antitoxin [Candidatus Desulfofervidaceae bacterium]